MKPNPILEETWRIKDQIARQANFDIKELCAQTRAWAAANLHSKPLNPGSQTEPLQPALHDRKRED